MPLATISRIRPSGLTHETFASHSWATVSLGALMSCPLVSVDLSQGVGNYRAVPEVVTRAGLRARFISTADPYSERGQHPSRVRYSDADRYPVGAYRGTSIGRAVEPGEESGSARTCLF